MDFKKRIIEELEMTDLQEDTLYKGYVQVVEKLAKEYYTEQLILSGVMQWVVLKDQKPTDGDYYICCLENGAVTECLYTWTDDRWFLKDRTEVRQHNKVVYWMERPKPPCA